MINSGTQPLQNLSVLKYYSPEPSPDRVKWAHHWIRNGLLAVEKVLSQGRKGKFCVGDEVTAADAFLVPQVTKTLTNFEGFSSFEIRKILHIK